jgi:hypothetical protein
LREAIREFKSLKRSSISLNEMDFQMYLVFYYSNGQKDRVAFDRNNRIFLNGVTYEKNPNLVKKLINCLPKGFSDVWMERKFRDF